MEILRGGADELDGSGSADRRCARHGGDDRRRAADGDVGVGGEQSLTATTRCSTIWTFRRFCGGIAARFNSTLDDLEKRGLIDTCFYAILLGSALLFLAPIRAGDLPGYDDALYAHIAKGIALTGDWLTPSSNGYPAFEHPPLYVWTEAALFRMFGSRTWWRSCRRPWPRWAACCWSTGWRGAC